MFKSIFLKLLVTYILLVTIVVTVLSLVFSLSYTQYIVGEKRRELEAAALKVSSLSESYIKGKIPLSELNTSLDSMGLVTEAAIYVVRVNDEELKNLSKLNIGADLTDPFIKDNLRQVLDGKKVFEQKQYFKNFDMDVIFVGYPLRIDSKISGAILLFLPMNSVSGVINQVNIIIFSSAFIILLLISIIIYIYSLRITKPIKDMELAAKRLAAGERTEDIKVTTSDEIGKLAHSFNFMKNELETTEKMRREFIANVSHDLRTPLTSINGFIQGMIDGIVKPEQYPEYLGIIKDEAARLLYLTGDILELAKIQSRSVSIHREKINLHKLLNGMLSSIKLMSTEKNINISITVDEKIEVYADAERLKQILFNIIGNSIRYTPQGGRITVSAQKNGDNILTEVSDNGVGISEEDLPFIFEKFYRADKVRNSNNSGTGLGLNIVKSLVELHNGKIYAKSREGIGTKISFTLPCKE
jgi:signal transduction histidine kinase